MKPECSICHIEMKFKERIQSKKQYRIRRFECPICGNIETIFADGKRDLEIDPEKAIESVDKIYKIEQDNRDF